MQADPEDPSEPPLEDNSGANEVRRAGSSRRVQRTLLTVAEWKGPLPPPDVIAAYNDIIPDGAERLFRQFELEAEHRRKSDERKQKYVLVDQLAGRGSALIFAIGALGVATCAIFAGMEAAAAVIGGTSLVVGVGYLMRVIWMRNGRDNED